MGFLQVSHQCFFSVKFHVTCITLKTSAMGTLAVLTECTSAVELSRTFITVMGVLWILHVWCVASNLDKFSGVTDGC